MVFYCFFSLFLLFEKMRKTVYISILLFSFFALFSCGRGKKADYPQINVDSIFIDLNKEIVAKRTKMAETTFNSLHQSGINGVILYAEQGQIIYEKALGFRNLVGRHKDSLRIDDAFQLSSDSKMFTAEAVMLLKAKGKLDYDDDVKKYIPELPYDGITIRMLLNHRSGLPRYDAMADAFWPDRTIPFSNEAMIKMLAERRPDPYGTPNSTYFYNNINYALLASVVERVSKQHFEDFMKKNIFEPLGMTHSYIYSMRNDKKVSQYMPCEVQGHDIYRSGPTKTQNDYLNGVMGDKIMFSTVEDLYKFNLALDFNLLLPENLQAEAFKPGSPEWKKDENYGFGWRMCKQHPGMYFHFGWWKGYRSVIIRNVVQNRFLVILTNTTINIPSETIWDFISDTAVQLPEAQLYKINY